MISASFCGAATAAAAFMPATAAASQASSAALATTGITLSPPPASTPVTFKSPLYSYGITLPAGWSVAPATARWDGASAPGNSANSVDKFVSPATVSVFGFAGPVKTDFDQFVKDTITWTVRDHADTCPAPAPEKTDRIRVGGEDGMLLSWDCGILINQALLISDGTGFVFVMRDPGVRAATDATDRALLDDLLKSVTLAS